MDETKRLDELEAKFTFQEELLNELNILVSRQQLSIDFLTKELKKLNEALSDGEDKQEKPPHY